MFLPQWEMDMDLVSTLINNSHHPQFYETEAVEAMSFDELANALLDDDDFPNPSNTFDHDCDFGYNLVDQFITTPSYNSTSMCSENHNDDDENNSNYENESVKTLVGSGVVQEPGQSTKRRKEEMEKKQLEVNVGKARRKRHPNQVKDHILAERKRREVLSHMFISLSAMIPGLKKMDKTTILGDAIKHMKQLQEKVKELEVAAAQCSSRNKSKVVVKKYQLAMRDDKDDDDNIGSSSAVVGDIISGSGGSGGSSANDNADNLNNKKNSSLPEIEVRKSDNTLLLKVYCEKHKGILSELITAMDRYDLSITSCVVIPFDELTLDIAIVAQKKLVSSRLSQ